MIFLLEIFIYHFTKGSVLGPTGENVVEITHAGADILPTLTSGNDTSMIQNIANPISDFL